MKDIANSIPEFWVDEQSEWVPLNDLPHAPSSWLQLPVVLSILHHMGTPHGLAQVLMVLEKALRDALAMRPPRVANLSVVQDLKFLFGAKHEEEKVSLLDQLFTLQRNGNLECRHFHTP